MPILGLGVHILVAILFAVHAVRNRRELYWLIVLFSFPLLGSLVYFLVVFLPHSRLERGLRKAGAAVHKTLDPDRDVRAAREAWDLAPTAHNQMRLAAALLDAGMVAAAVEQYDACLVGPFAHDPEIGLGAACAKLANGQPHDAVTLLTALRQQSPTFRPEQAGLALAKAYAVLGRHADAREEFGAMVARFGSIEARVEFALWAIERKDIALARRELAEIEHARKHMPGHTRTLHRQLFDRLDSAFARLRAQ